MNRLTRISRLKELISSTKINHDDQILVQPTLKDAHIYCVLNSISAQHYGILLEKYIISKYRYTKHNASECRGDCSDEKDNIEIKASLGGATHTRFNYVQLRITQNISSYLLTAYHLTTENVDNEGDLYIFRVPKESLKTIVAQYGTYAHGTHRENGDITLESMDDPQNKKEYALRPKYGDKCWSELCHYLVEETEL